MGGIVEIASDVVADRFDAIAFILDPTDPTAESPENVALQRACISKGIPQLMNFGDLAHWIEYEAGRESEFDGVEIDALPAGQRVHNREEVVALVAHDGKKQQMFDFFVQYARFLTAKHSELLATGTTGRLVAELCRGTGFENLATRLGPDGPERLKALLQDESLQIKKRWPLWLRQLERWRLEGWTIVSDVHQPGAPKP